jgi:hypothetical protein
MLAINLNGRVTAGNYSPAVPTDPDVPDSSIRLLELWSHYAAVNTVNDPRLGERIACSQTGKFFPRHTGSP